MLLKVTHRTGAPWRGKTYAKGETFEVDPAEHNVASQVRYLKALKKVEEVDGAEPEGHVATTAPIAAEPAPEATPEPPAATETEDPPAAPKPRRGQYRTRDLQAED